MSCCSRSLASPQRLIPATLILLAAFVPSAVAENPAGRFVNVGMGGGGAMFVPACSPHDQNLMYVACDMGGVYRSVDGGKTWNMLDKRQLHDAIRQGLGSPVQFHPTEPDLLYAIGSGKLLSSRDRGISFGPVAVQPPWSGGVAAVCVNPVKPSQLLVGAGSGIYVSDDAGKNWTKSAGSSGRVLKFFVAGPSTANEGAIFAGTTDGVFRSDDNGQIWRDASQGLPERELRGFCGGQDAKMNRTALYCTVASKVVDGKLIGGIFRSLDGGHSWQSTMSRGLNLDIGKQDPYGFDKIPQYRFVAMAENRPNVVYVTTRGTGSKPPHHFTVFRSDDFGDTWRHCFNPGANVEPGWVPVDLNWGWGGPALGFNVCSSNPEVAMFANGAALYITRDGGGSWHSAYSQRVDSKGDARPGEAWTSCGLEVTTCWQVAIDPHDPRRMYVCYTDIGFARSEDRGQTWRYSGRGSPWRNTWYQIAFDPLRPGVIYGACSNHHDIPNYMELDPARQREPRRRGGGVCISEDHGASWRPLGQGLPEGSATSIVLDQKSPADRRTLYVAMFGHGVFKSADSGTTWHKASQGLGTAENMHAYLVKLHPDGTLLCTVTGKRSGTEFSDGSGLYRSRDGGQHWQCISPPLKWANGFDFDPRDSRTIYVAVSTAPRHPQGGLYKTSDGGASWQQVVKEGDLPRELHGFIHAFFVSLHPTKPNTVYFSTLTHGLFISEDGGSTWREVHGIPFTGVNRVTFDPLDDDTIWLTTEGGGVWKGPARGL
jgi:photosystem II stability/assembly factor-like uncharacterized protein